MTMKTGEVHEGEYAEGLFNGFGVYYWDSGINYQGYFERGKKNGKGE
jgi:hypothetical protein